LSEGIAAFRYLFENLLGKQNLAGLRVYIQRTDLSQRSGGWQCQPDRYTPQQTSSWGGGFFIWEEDIQAGPRDND